MAAKMSADLSLDVFTAKYFIYTSVYIYMYIYMYSSTGVSCTSDIYTASVLVLLDVWN
jgi:hypothetical protein